MNHRSNLIADYERGVQNGRGQGTGAQYQPWLRTADVTNSTGMRCRLFVKKFGRTIHVLSRSELLTLLRLDWNDSVTELYEQIPLNPTETQAIAQKLNIRHPGFANAGIVMTTDFFFRMRIGFKFRSFAIQVKSAPSDTVSKRVQEKLRIEQQYWTDRKVEWRIVYASNLNRVKSDNLERLAQWRNIPCTEPDMLELSMCLREMQAACPQAGAADLRAVNLKLPSGLALNAFEGALFLIAQKRCAFPIDQMRLEEVRLQDFRLNHA